MLGLRFFSSSGASNTPNRLISPADGASSRFMLASALRYAAWRARVRAACPNSQISTYLSWGVVGEEGVGSVWVEEEWEREGI